MPIFRVTEKLFTYATCDIEAPSAAEAIAKVSSFDVDFDPDWSYLTDYDDSLGITAKELSQPLGER